VSNVSQVTTKPFRRYFDKDRGEWVIVLTEEDDKWNGMLRCYDEGLCGYGALQLAYREIYGRELDG
jgi:hypothetical protein